MTSDSSTSVLIIIFCIIFSGYFSATETAFSSLNRIRIKNMAEKGDKRAKLVLDMLENGSSLELVADMMVNIQAHKGTKEELEKLLEMYKKARVSSKED